MKNKSLNRSFNRTPRTSGAATTDDTPSTWLVVKLVFASRAIYLCIAVASSLLATEYDTSVTVSNKLSASTIHHTCTGSVSRIALSLMKPLIRWDAVYFLSIAESGYTYEQQFAFFPGLPLLMRSFAALLRLITGGSMCDQALLAMAGLFVTNMMFVGAAISLYWLSIHILRDNRLAVISAALFAFSPAGIFMSSIYTESPFAMCAFAGMLCMVRGRIWYASAWWFCASLIRANGILLAGFLVWDMLHPFSPQKNLSYYSWNLFCTGMDGIQRPWCTNFIPSLYSFVQDYYWNNGFLKYYTLQQIPNFLLATPYLLVSVMGISEFIYRYRLEVLSLGFITSQESERAQLIRTQLPFMYLWMAMLAICALFMHVQVILRFFTSMPMLFWVLAQWLGQCSSDTTAYRLGMAGSMFSVYYAVYPAVGAVLFACFLPPA
ncbi:hypothetical protein BASA50_006458 [Batrachochytrium salamandrivorans]|uniref:GPI mannosyltransferase 2 n=1 Tax=Batrachochytrium salamandrivorans TaxID=1357716 RepID=A0ABQ8F9H6_9FUNG|nr:hypothetical protein BASA50_006458 [Batrachochytrium salamandrivorans]